MDSSPSPRHESSRSSALLWAVTMAEFSVGDQAAYLSEQERRAPTGPFSRHGRKQNKMDEFRMSVAIALSQMEDNLVVLREMLAQTGEQRQDLGTRDSRWRMVIGYGKLADHHQECGDERGARSARERAERERADLPSTHE